jgi:hypothetical protein
VRAPGAREHQNAMKAAALLLLRSLRLAAELRSKERSGNEVAFTGSRMKNPARVARGVLSFRLSVQR